MFNNVEVARAIEEFLASSPTLTTANGVGFRNGVVTILTRANGVGFRNGVVTILTRVLS